MDSPRHCPPAAYASRHVDWLLVVGILTWAIVAGVELALNDPKLTALPMGEAIATVLGYLLFLAAFLAIAIDHLGNARRREITQQMGGPAVRFAAKRIAQVGAERVVALVEGGLGAPIKVTLQDAKGKQRATLELQSDWWPGAPVWTGKVHGRPVSVQVRPTLNGHDLAYRGIRAKVHVYTEQEAKLAALMPEKAPPDTSKLLLYLDPTIDVSLGDIVRAKSLRETYLGLGVSHRSGIFGSSKLFNNVDGGSNYIYAYLEWQM